MSFFHVEDFWYGKRGNSNRRLIIRLLRAGLLALRTEITGDGAAARVQPKFIRRWSIVGYSAMF